MKIIKTMKKNNFKLLLATLVILCAGSLSVATEIGILRIDSPKELIRKFRSSRKAKRRHEQEAYLLFI
jgi:hypothetical protein